MDWNSMISAAAIIIVALIEGLAARERKNAKKDKAKTERRAEDRAKENRLSMQMMDASIDLSLATALAIERGQTNGEMKAAREKAAMAQENYTNFLQELAARQVAKV